MRKSMHFSDPSGKLIHYIPARLTEGKDWFVSYYATDPYTGELRRKRIKLNRIKGQKARRDYSRELIEQINSKLRGGWNPFLEAIAPKGSELLFVAIGIFLKRKGAMLRPDSMRSYNSQCARLLSWLELIGQKDIRSGAFSAFLARDYMEYRLDEKIGSTTFNNTLTVMRVVFNWMKERQYCADCPFDKIKKLREGQKFRKLIPEEWRERIRDHLKVKDPGFLLACMLQFYAEIRPTEQTKLVMRNIDLANKVIEVPPHAAKNGEGRFPTIPDPLMPYLLALPWSELSGDDFIVGADFRPGRIQMADARPYTLCWKQLRKELKMPKEYQFYSLRDSGIVYMIDSGISLNHVMKQAAHASLHTTTKYVKFANQNAVPQIKALKKGF